ncbi:MAG TPA: hypothetical protein VLY04_26165 [Bryobacteraceae bacterium]|nr:hypothetical protein [Bryobacteraceae bacterium]
MLQIARRAPALILAFSSLILLGAADSDRDFSGEWYLDRTASDLRALSVETYETLTVEQDGLIRCTAVTANGGSVQWSYKVNGDETKYQIGGESMSSVVKWEGAALLVNTLVSGPQDYTVMDRWTLSRDRTTLTIQRQISRGTWQTEGSLVYRHARLEAGTSITPGVPVVEAPPAAGSQQPLARRPEPAPPPAPTQYVVPTGTHILLTLSNPISTKNSKEGDRVYLQTAVPIALDGHIVIPRGSYVQGSVTKTAPAGRMSHKGELYLRFDSLTLPNGVTRDFRARLTSADPSKGKVDSDEGKITGDSGKDPGKVTRDVGIGSVGGVIVGSAAGHPITGLGAGAAAGLAAVLLSKNQEVILPRGTSVEMVLDRDLYYTPEELRR